MIFGIFCLFIFGGSASFAAHQDGTVKENWGYTSVRPGAQMFYWVYFTQNYTQRPLVLWLQGGPGASSTGVGNFLEIGPVDLKGKMREHAWTKDVSVVFLDSPVGSGFSYVWNETLIPKSDAEAATDVLTFLKIFYRKITDLQDCPLYVFGESYGGKIAAELGLQLTQAVKKKKIFCHFKGLGLGDAWISPTDSVDNYANFLHANSLIDLDGMPPLMAEAHRIRAKVDNGSMLNATKAFFDRMEPLVANETNGVNFYNILALHEEDLGLHSNHISASTGIKKAKSSILQGMLPKSISSDLSKFMNGPIKTKLKIPKNITWDGQSSLVMKAMMADFMRPAVKTVEYLLNTTNLQILVYNGQLDLIVPSMGSESWVRKMKWAGIKQWPGAKRNAMLSATNATLGFVKTVKNFSFSWILRAGHLVPYDAPMSALSMLRKFLFRK